MCNSEEFYMTDPIREAFERWASGNPPFSPIEIWQAAWQQSRREALMEAAEICDGLANAAECAIALQKLAAEEDCRE